MQAQKNNTAAVQQQRLFAFAAVHNLQEAHSLYYNNNILTALKQNCSSLQQFKIWLAIAIEMQEELAHLEIVAVLQVMQQNVVQCFYVIRTQF